MARNENRKQKSLLKKKRKDKDRKNRKAETSGDVRSSKSIIKNARELPIHECLINPQWKEEGMASILISRKQPTGNLAFGVFMVDIFCLGLKNTFCNADIPLQEYEDGIKDTMRKQSTYIECDIDLAHRIIYGAIEFARELGFEPQKDFKLSRYILEEPSEKYYSSDLEFGKNGKPYYIAGPDDNVDYVMRKLSKRVGEGNYHFTHPMGM